MSTEDLRSNDLVVKSKSKKLGSVMRIGFTVAKYAALVGIIIVFLSNSQRSSDDLVAWITDVVEPVGFVAVVLLPLMIGIYRSIIRRDISRLANSVGGVLAGLALYSVVLWALGLYGEATKNVVVTHPAESLALVLGLTICWLLGRVAIRKENDSRVPHRNSADYRLLEN